MTALARVIRKLDGAMNPVAVRELRQAVRSGVVTIGFVLFVLALLGAMGMYLLDQDAGGTELEGGREIFTLLTGILVAASVGLLPIYTGTRLAAERGGVNADLLFITTLSPGRIVRGKMLAAAMLTVMVFSACAPFVTFTYLLRGIDFPTIFLVIAASFLLSVTASQLAIFLAALPVSVYVRVLIWLAFAGMMMALLPALFDGHSGVLSSIIIWGVNGWAGLWEAWPQLGTLLALDIVALGLFHVLTVALFMPPAANRTLRVRIYLTIAWLVSGVLAAAWADELGFDEPMALWGYGWWGFLACCMIVAVSERTSWGPRITRTIPANPLLRAGAFVLYTGAAGGVTWVVIMILLTAAALGSGMGGMTTMTWGPGIREDVEILMGLTFFAFAYSMTAALLRRYVLRRILPERHTGALAALLLCLGCFLPLLAALVLYSGSRWRGGPHAIAGRAGWWNALNPFMLWEHDCRSLCTRTALVWAAVAALLSVPWYVEQVVLFRRSRPPEGPGETPEAPAPAAVPDGLELVDDDERKAE